MHQFDYFARHPLRGEISGQIEAKDKIDAIKAIERVGFTPIRVSLHLSELNSDAIETPPPAKTGYKPTMLQIGICVIGCAMFILLLVTGAAHNDSGRGVTLLFGLLSAYIAQRKGCNPWCWVLSGGLTGLIILHIVTNNYASDSPEIKDANKVGVVMSIITVLWATLSVVACFTLTGK